MSIAWMMILLAGLALRAEVVHVYEQTVAGGVTNLISDVTRETGGDYVSSVAPALSGYIFTGWSSSAGSGLVSRDDWGRACDAAPYHLEGRMVLTANYVDATLDTDGDGLADGTELYWYGNHTQTSDSDTDGDGYTFAQELAAGTSPLMPDRTIVGGVAHEDSDEVEVDLQPHVTGDAATVTGNADTGCVVKPSADVEVVEIDLRGVDPSKVTVEVSAKVKTVAAKGAKVKVVNGADDITEFLDMPTAGGNGVIDLTQAHVKEEFVKEAMDVEKGAVIELNAASPKLTTPNTRKGLFYQLREGETIGGMTGGDSTIGDGNPWTPTITVKGGNAAFYTIGVGKPVTESKNK